MCLNIDHLYYRKQIHKIITTTPMPLKSITIMLAVNQIVEKNIAEDPS